jgi:predicted Zn-dependent protease
VVAAAPQDAEARRGLALARYRGGDAEGALADLNAVLESEPEHVDAWTWKAQVLLDLDRAEEARVAAERARDLAPWTPRPWFVLSTAWTDLGKPKEAQAASERFQRLAAVDQEIRRLEARLEYEPGDLVARRALIESLASVGDRRSVRTHLAHLLQERPGDVTWRIFALDVLDGLGDVEAGAMAAKDLERVGAESAPAWKRLEAWYAKVRDRTKQIEAGERWRRLSRP